MTEKEKLYARIIVAEAYRDLCQGVSGGKWTMYQAEVEELKRRLAELEERDK